MDFGIAFSFPFQDEDWVKKIVLTAVISLIPIIGQIALVGWLVDLSRRVINGESNPMPDWTDFGGLLVLGLKMSVIGFVYALPLLFVSFPWAIMDALINNESAAALYVMLSMCFGCVTFLYGLALAFFFPAAVGELAATDDLGAAINPTNMIAHVRAAPNAYLLAFLGTIVAGFISGFGIIFCFVGIIFTIVYASAIQGHLYGQAYIEATKA
jgi:Sec-independent protein secretion pathway component TatC